MDDELKKLRHEAHVAFDQLWQSRNYTREHAYGMLARMMRLPPVLAHFACFDKEQCRFVIQFWSGMDCRKYKPRRKQLGTKERRLTLQRERERDFDELEERWNQKAA